MSFRHDWSLDSCAIATDAFVTTHPGFQRMTSCHEASRYMKSWTGSDMEPQMVFQCDIQDAWFLNFTGIAGVSDVIVLSPPCQPWSLAHQSQGFNKREGLALVHAVTKLAHLKPKVVGLEEVAQFGRHPQFQIFVRILEWAGYAIVSSQTLNLNHVLPQNRSRFLLVAVHKSATDACKLIDWVDWIPEQLSMKNSGCLADFDEDTMCDLIPSNDVLNIYLDPKNLPRHPDGGEYAKRSIDEVVKYRIRGPDDASFSCIMANYSKGHTLPDIVLKQGGVYGAFVRQGQIVRFLHPCEVMYLQGVTNEVTLNVQRLDQFLIMGNSISIPHATICILNALRSQAWVSADDIPKFFAAVFAKRLTNMNSIIVQDQYGVCLRQVAADPTAIDPTQETQCFVSLFVEAPTEQIMIEVESGVCIFDMLQRIMGKSIPGQIRLKIRGELMIPLMMNENVGDDVTRLRVNVPSVMLLSDSNFITHVAPIIICLTAEGPIVMNRVGNMEVAQMFTVAQTFFPEHISNAVPCDSIGVPLELTQICPDCVMFMQPREFALLNMGEIENVAFTETCGHLQFLGTWSKVMKLIQVLQKTKVIQTCKNLGWAFEIVAGANSNGLIKLIVARLPGRLAVTLDHLQMYLATIVTLALWPQPVESHENICHLKIKMWFSWAWNGRIPLSAKVGEFLQPWHEAARVFGMKNYLRAIVKGRQTMPECSFSDLAFPNEELRLRTKAGIEAKNRMAMFLLSNGADIQQTAHFVDGVLKHISVQSVNLIMAETNDQKKLKALQQVAQSLNIEWPKFTRSEASKIDKTKAWAKQKMGKPTQVCAEQFQLIPGAFMNEDETHSAIKQAVTPGSTGVVLLSPEKAAPWIQEHAVISSDEFAIVVLGHNMPSR